MRHHILYAVSFLALCSVTISQSSSLLQKQELELAEDLTDSTKVSIENIKARIQRKYSPVTPPATTLSVQTSTDLSYNERKFVKHRMEHVQNTLRKKFTIAQPLRIAFCCSGGDCEAMIGTLGIMQAAENHGILDATLYLAGQSGSTWLIAPWAHMYLHNNIPQQRKQSFQTIQKSLGTALNNPLMTIHGLSSPPDITDDLKDDFMANIVKRFGYNQPLTIIDIYGQLIGNFALKPANMSRLGNVWSSITEKITKGKIPLPLCLSVYEINQSDSSNQQYGCFETNPCDAGSADMGYIPIQYLGSKFTNGKIRNKGLCPEYPLTFFLGIYGSAPALHFSEMYNNIIDSTDKNPHVTVLGQRIKIPMRSWIQKITDFDTQIDGNDHSDSPKAFAHFNNFSHGVSSSVLSQEPTFGLTDASNYMHFPLPLLFDRPDRKIDLIFMYDATAGDAAYFQEATQYFASKNIKAPDFSNVTTKELQSKSMTLFNDPQADDYDASIPTFIYLPTLTIDLSQEPYTRFNFEYQAKDIDRLVANTKDSFEQNIEKIVSTLQSVAEKRYPEITTKLKKYKPFVKKYRKKSTKKSSAAIAS